MIIKSHGWGWWIRTTTKTRGQSPPNYHYSNPQYKQDTNLLFVASPLSYISKAETIGFEPIIHKV